MNLRHEAVEQGRLPDPELFFSWSDGYWYPHQLVCSCIK